MTKRVVTFTASACAAFSVIFAAWQYPYPYGVRTCFVPCMMSALRQYAEANDGQFPTDPDPYVALVKVRPFLYGADEILAGLTGDRDEVRALLAETMNINSNVCSWVYLPGRSFNVDSEAIIIYERKSGVMGNGRRGSGRMVGFANGHFTVIPDEKWETFLTKRR